MKCPLRVDALGNFGDSYTDECSWWNDGCIVVERMSKDIPERFAPKLKSNKFFAVRDVAKIINLKDGRIYALAMENILLSVAIGRQIRFSSEAIEDFY